MREAILKISLITRVWCPNSEEWFDNKECTDFEPPCGEDEHSVGVISYRCEGCLLCLMFNRLGVEEDLLSYQEDI